MVLGLLSEHHEHQPGLGPTAGTYSHPVYYDHALDAELHRTAAPVHTDSLEPERI